MVFGRGVLIIYIVYLTSKPDGVKNLITKGVKKYPLFEQRCGQERWGEFWGF
ncbi:hypothetical protein [Riemerella anatipestifer]|uniref:Uncharacterized protein n=1 Tax=Riemerella anatipestifer RA-CH-1 TaxID=1228997 RepID=J9QT50_RIEAN|nr:hypothetical protein [Riemerella anatipestifer]AFR35331.1 hypothetical protein B739_0729 [Riemerella anatipestifer RA-CH-1]MCO7332290.1 hypothetical protein [Riemerella anatipestifer]MCO7351180.1 hypothetical protein [Riemerella anatipestifer]MCW0486310.1 hypothetical protein [Riemerella anatipestifer]MCW0493489.1 hypothetical protein [Riemerella anatipestifer]